MYCSHSYLSKRKVMSGVKGKVVGKVSQREKNEIMKLVERLSALHELRLGKDNLNISEEQKNAMFSKIEQDEKKVKYSIQQWWRDKYNKYHWEQTVSGMWRLDYESCNVILTEVISS